MLLLGDDDVLLDGALPWLVELLAREPCEAAFLRPSAFERDFRTEIGTVDTARTYRVFDDPRLFLRAVNIDATFISSNVIRKASLKPGIDLRRFSGTNLIQLGWTLPAILGGGRFLYVERALLAGRVNNSTGFDFFRVFGVNYLAILDALRGDGLDAGTHVFLVEHLLAEFFPRRIHSIRSGKERYDEGGRGIVGTLRPAFGHLPLFWLFVAPAAVLPVPLVRPWRKLAALLLACWRLLARPFR